MTDNKISNIKKWVDEKIVNPGDEYSPVYQEFRRRVHITSFVIFVLFTLLGTGIYVGFSYFNPKLWSYLWTLTLSGLIVASLVRSLLYGRMMQFAYPLLLLAIYFPVAATYNIYHPLWAIFLSIPLYYLLGIAIDKIKRKD